MSNYENPWDYLQGINQLLQEFTYVPDVIFPVGVVINTSLGLPQVVGERELVEYVFGGEYEEGERLGLINND